MRHVPCFAPIVFMRRHVPLLAVLLVGCAAAPEQDLERVGQSDDQLIGGVDAKPGDYPSTVKYFAGGSYCSASKIAPNKILTAAHCVVGEDARFRPWLAGQELAVTNSPSAPTKDNDSFTPILSNDPAKGAVKVRFTGTYVDPVWTATHDWSKGTDLAVYIIADEDVPALAAIPIASVDFSPVPVGAPITIMGFGCDDPSLAYKVPSHLKYGFTQTLAAGSDDVRQRYMITPGPDRGTVASLCPGDSGGPTYGGHVLGTGAKIVGVSSGGSSDTGLFTRVSNTWLQKVLTDSADPTLFVPISGGFGMMSCRGGKGFVVGAIKDKYSALGGCTSALGLPVSAENATPDGKGRYSVFANGSIYWTAATGAHEVRGAIRDAWEVSGWEKGPLGYPTSDELPATDKTGAYTSFEHGVIYTSPKTGAHAVAGRILDKWRELGLEQSPLGYPITDEYATDGGRRSDFEHGHLIWVSATNQVSVEMN